MNDNVEILRRYNRWRRGQALWSATADLPDPRVVGEAIDAACDEIERMRAENAELQNELTKGIHTCGPTCRKTPRCAEMADLRAELAVERKRQSAMRTLIASQEGTLSHYRSKQAEADEAVRTLDSERQANATLTAELSECKADAERYHWIKQCALFGITKRQDIVLTLPIYAANHIGELDAAIDAALAAREE